MPACKTLAVMCRDIRTDKKILMRRQILIISLTFIFLSCGYRVTKGLDGQTIIDQKKFTLNQPMAAVDFATIDTSAIYKKILYNSWDYNEYLKFYGNGSYINIFKKTDFQPLNVACPTLKKTKNLTSLFQLDKQFYYTPKIYADT